MSKNQRRQKRKQLLHGTVYVEGPDIDGSFKTHDEPLTETPVEPVTQDDYDRAMKGLS